MLFRNWDLLFFNKKNEEMGYNVLGLRGWKIVHLTWELTNVYYWDFIGVK